MKPTYNLLPVWSRVVIDYEAALKLWKVDKLDFVACLCSFLGVLVISVPLGLLIAVIFVGVSVFKILLHVTRPSTLVLRNIPGTEIYQNVNRYKEALMVPSFLILAVESPMFSANSTYLQERILRWIREEEEYIVESKGSELKCVILDMTAVTSIDTIGIDTISELRKMLEKKSLQVSFFPKITWRFSGDGFITSCGTFTTRNLMNC